ncbi:MAG: SusC/RagA family TonB-linked outer membrane protein [Chitinophagaceae bacterium]|nr:MAG: SusC/RagA family TonB-linked outer membrane protein [Chitinophagaceae bacterium]
MRKIASLLSMSMLVCTLAFGQARTITGQVRDASGTPVPFASVTEAGTKNTVSADANGNFSIRVGNNASRLSITATGYNSETISVSGNVATVSLNRQEGTLETVVVTTGLGIRRQAREVGYAATSVSNRTLTAGKAVNVQQALVGKVSGLNVTTTNSSVFENSKLLIRGIRSLTGNNQPMLLVDGVPTPLGFLSTIPPGDIQDVTVLKSAASAAIYGPDAVNGVIAVTTKRGTGNRLNISFSSTIQAARVAYFPKLQRRFGAGAGETTDIYGNYGYVEYENQQYGPEFDGSIKPIGPVLENGSQQFGPYSDLHYKDKINFWNTGLTIQNSVSVAGQDFFFSVDDANIKGLMPKDKNRRTSFRFNGGKKTGKFSVDYGLNYILGNYDVVNEAGVAGLFPGTYGGSIMFSVMQTSSNVPLLNYKDWRNDYFSMYSNYYNGYAVNPYWAIDNVRSQGRSDDIIGNINLGYQLLPWMKANVRVGTNLNFYSAKTSNGPIFVTDFAKDHRDGTQYGADRPGSVGDQSGYSSRINLEYFLNGDRNFGDFTVRYIAGGMMRQNRQKDLAMSGTNLVVPYLFNVGSRSGEANVSESNVQNRLLSAFGSVGFGYKGWAFVEFTGRNDWDSRLLAANRSFFYPGVNGSVILSDAIGMMKNSRTLSYAKLRAAWSKSGNVNLGTYATLPTYSQPAGFPYGTFAGYTAGNTIPSADLKPEFVETKEVGVELGFLKNRINIEATYYHQNNTNQILTIQQSWASGYPTAIANAADFKNYGFEGDINLTPLVKVGKAAINFRFNAHYNNNEVIRTLNDANVVVGGSGNFTQNAGSSPSASNVAVVGMPAFAFQLTDYKRDPQGRVIVDSLTGMPTQASAQIIKGRTLPLWTLGFTPSVAVGNFNFSMTWDYRTGHNFYSQLGSDMDFAGISEGSAQYGRRRFVFPNSVIAITKGPNPEDVIGYRPNENVQVQDGNYGFWATSATNTSMATNYFASAAAWRLREVNISYTLPNKWLGGASKFIRSVSLSAVGRNLLLIVPKSNNWGDPEFNQAGNNNNTFGLASAFQSPAARYFGGTLSVQF